MHEKPTGEEVKEVYARFGLAYYFSEVLHRGLCNAYALAPFESEEDVNRLRIEERLDLAWSTTLGQIAQHMEETDLPQPLIDRLARAVEKRNSLAHDFWFENIHKLVSRTGIEELLVELDEAIDTFRSLNEEVEDHHTRKHRKLGIPEEIFEEAMEEMLSGKERQPLHDQRTPNKQERVVAAHKALAPDGHLLVFETADGELWQLSDAGLAWAPFDEVKTDWDRAKRLMQYLPATIDPRSEGKGPFHYSIELANGGVLRVEKRDGNKVWTVEEE